MLFPRSRRTRAQSIGWLALVASLVACLSMAFVPSPYVVEGPGPTFDTLGEADDADLISIADAPSYEYDDEGTLRLLTVSLYGSPQSPLTWIDVAEAYFDDAAAIVPLASAFPEGTTVEDANEASRIEMENSQQAAIAAALIEQGIDFDARVTIAGIIEGTPAVGLLEEGDRILTVNGDTAYDVASIRQSIAAAEGPTTFVVERDGEQLTVEVTPEVDADGARTVGIYPQNEFTFPLDVEIQLPNVGGPSAGMMFALGIIDRMTEGSLTNDVDWAGTGTISALGQVGPIGGIVQKLHGAADAGAEWFLAPSANCDEVVGHVPEGMHVVSVDTLSDAITAIQTVATDGEASQLPTCG